MKTRVCRSVATTKTILLLGSDLALHYELCTQNVNALLVQEATLLLLWKAQEVRDLGMSPVRTQPRKARIAYRMPLEGNWQSWLTPGWELGTFCSEAGSWGDRAVTTAAPTAPLYRITDCTKLSQKHPTTNSIKILSFFLNANISEEGFVLNSIPNFTSIKPQSKTSGEPNQFKLSKTHDVLFG